MSSVVLFGTMLAAGACVGSFLGVLAYRLPLGAAPWAGRSHCECCGYVLRARDLVPIASFLALRGRCGRCSAPIRREILAFELAAAGIGGVCAWLFGGFDAALCAAVLGWGMLALGWIDARFFMLPDVITLPVMAAGLGATFLLQPQDFLSHVAGAAAGFLVFVGVNALYRRLRRRNGLGGGDAKLMALAGAWVGWAPLPWVVLAAGGVGLIYAFAQWRRGEILNPAMRLPFGAFLAPAIFAAYLLVTIFPGYIGN